MRNIEHCLSTRGNLATDTAAADLLDKVRKDLEESMERLSDRRSESGEVFSEAFASLSRPQDPLDPVPTVVHQKQLVCGLKCWCVLFQTAYIQAVLRVSAEALDRLDRLERRSWKSMFISIGGFCAGLPLLFLGLFKPFFDGLRYCYQKCRPLDDRRPKITLAYTRWEQIKNLAFYNTHRRIRPSTVLQNANPNNTSTHLVSRSSSHRTRHN